MEYQEAREIMAKHKHNVENGHGRVASLAKDKKKLTFRTFLYRKESPNNDTPEHYEIHYFSTAIITLYHDKVVLNDGGWFSHSTHQRLNEFMPRGFRVSGSYISWLKATVGFIHTPAGTHAYAMPFGLRYDGSDQGCGGIGEDNSPEAGKALHCIRAYVDSYIKRLFNGELTIDHDPPELLPNYISHDIADFVLRNTAYPNGLAFEIPSIVVGDDYLDDILDVLMLANAKVLKKPRTKDDVAARTEAIYLLKAAIPTCDMRELRRVLRRELSRYMLTTLGFTEKTWNRRA